MVKPTGKAAIVWDLGNVLIRWDPRNLYRRMFPTDEAGAAAMEWFLAQVCNGTWNEQRDAGQSFASGIEELVARYPDHDRYIRAYFERWPEMLGGPIDDNVALLTELERDGWPVYALTNWSAETFPHARERFGFLELFDGIVMSGEEGLIKPDPRFYQVLFARYGLDPAQLVFIDDSRANIAAAAQLGMKTIHYRPGTDTRQELRTLLAPRSK